MTYQANDAYLCKRSAAQQLALVGGVERAVQMEKTQSQENAERTRRVPTLHFLAPKGWCQGK